MHTLWLIKEGGKDWTKEQRSEYDKHAEAVKKLDEDIKLRSEYVDHFQKTLPKEDKKFKELEKRASIFNIIKKEIYLEKRDSNFKIDSGPINEVLQERLRKLNPDYVKGDPVPLNEFGRGMKQRATVSTVAGSGKDLVEDTIMPEIVPNLYAKAWCGRAGCEFVENWRGGFLLPAEDTKPASGFIAETADYPESSIDYKNAINLQPLKCGALQPFSLQSFMQDETKQLTASINSQLMREWAKKVDDDFMNADGNPATEPKGILNITGIQEQDSGTTNNGDPLSFEKLIDAEGLLKENDQDKMPVWVTNSKVITKARKTLRNNVAGSLYIGDNRQIADRRFVETNVVKSNLTKGSSGAVLSQAVLIIPSSIVIVQWAMPAISIDRSLGFKNDTVWTKISGYVNVGLKRPKDVVNYKNISTT